MGIETIQQDVLNLGVDINGSLVIWLSLSILISAFFNAYLWRKWKDSNCWFGWFSFFALGLFYAARKGDLVWLKNFRSFNKKDGE